jgi:hypothetical protein
MGQAISVSKRFRVHDCGLLHPFWEIETVTTEVRPQEFRSTDIRGSRLEGIVRRVVHTAAFNMLAMMHIRRILHYDQSLRHKCVHFSLLDSCSVRFLTVKASF